MNNNISLVYPTTLKNPVALPSEFDPETYSQSQPPRSSSLPLNPSTTDPNHNARFVLPLPTTATNEFQNQTGIPNNPSYNLAHLGKDGDLGMIERQLRNLIEEVDSIISETTTVFGQLETIYSSEARPMYTVKRLAELISRFSRLSQMIRTSGLGGLPIQWKSSLDDIANLIELKQSEVNLLYRERQRQREGSRIVLGVLESTSTSSLEPLQTQSQQIS